MTIAGDMAAPGRISALSARIAAAAGPLPRLAKETAAWATLMAASAALSLVLDAWQDEARILQVAILFLAGALLAYPPAVVAAELVAGRHGAETRLAAHVLALAAATVAITALVNGLWLRSYFAAWHGPFLSIEWCFQFVFTVGGGAYQFALFGLRLYLLVGVPALALFAVRRAFRPR